MSGGQRTQPFFHRKLIHCMADSDRLASGEVEVVGLLPGSSNYTFLAKLIGDDSSEQLVVYKPRKGETPLWDFPEGTLCQREVAAYLIARLAGWDFVPETILRDGPLGPGAVQSFIQHHPEFTIFDADGSHKPALMRIALFDLIINNADRKAGHVLLGSDGHLWAIDHGVCFAEEPKLRTVLWDFIGLPLSPSDVASLKHLLEVLQTPEAEGLRTMLSPDEMAALNRRTHGLMEDGVFPSPGPGRPYPWPLV